MIYRMLSDRVKTGPKVRSAEGKACPYIMPEQIQQLGTGTPIPGTRYGLDSG
jgi:hypothetical protein